MKTIYVVGGGSSLNNFNWNLLDGENVIAVNRAYEKLPNAQWVYFSDLRFWQWHNKYLDSHKGKKITGNYRIKDSNVEIWKFKESKGLELEYKRLNTGNSSGYSAINLAYHLGAKKIVLLGFDMYMHNGKFHWHDGYPVANRNKFDNMLKYFETIAKPLSDLGIEVLNASPDSKIECFTKITIEEAFSEKCLCDV